MKRRRSLRWKRRAGLPMLALAAASCTAVLGIDKDYRELDRGTGGTASSTGAAGGAAPSSSSTSASTGAGGAGVADSGPGPTTVIYKATIADCVNIANPNPDVCEMETGAGQLRIDSSDAATGNAY